MHIDVQGLNGQPLPKWVKWFFLEKIGKWFRIYQLKDKVILRNLKNFSELQIFYKNDIYSNHWNPLFKVIISNRSNS